MKKMFFVFMAVAVLALGYARVTSAGAPENDGWEGLHTSDRFEAFVEEFNAALTRLQYAEDLEGIQQIKRLLFTVAKQTDVISVRDWFHSIFAEQPRLRASILNALSDSSSASIHAWLEDLYLNNTHNTTLRFQALTALLDSSFSDQEEGLLRLYYKAPEEHRYHIVEALPSTERAFLFLMNEVDQAEGSLLLAIVQRLKAMQDRFDAAPLLFGRFPLAEQGEESIKDSLVYRFRQELADYNYDDEARAYLIKRWNDNTDQEPYFGFYNSVIIALQDLGMNDPLAALPVSAGWQQAGFGSGGVPGGGAAGANALSGVETQCDRDPPFQYFDNPDYNGHIMLAIHNGAWLPEAWEDDKPGNSVTGNLSIGQCVPFSNPITPVVKLLNISSWTGFTSNSGKNTKQDLEFEIENGPITRSPGAAPGCWVEHKRDPITGRLIEIAFREPLGDCEARDCEFKIISYDMASSAILVAGAPDFPEPRIDIPIDTDKDMLPDAYEDKGSVVTFDTGTKRVVGLDACKNVTVNGVNDAQSDYEADYNYEAGSALGEMTFGDGTSEWGEYRGFLYNGSGLIPDRETEIMDTEGILYKPGTKKIWVHDQTPAKWVSSIHLKNVENRLAKYLGVQPFEIAKKHTDPWAEAETRDTIFKGAIYPIENLIGAINFNNGPGTLDESYQAGVRFRPRKTGDGLVGPIHGFVLGWNNVCVSNGSSVEGNPSVNDYLESSSGKVLGLPIDMHESIITHYLATGQQEVAGFNPADFTQSIAVHELTHKLPGILGHDSILMEKGADIDDIDQFIMNQLSTQRDLNKYFPITDTSVPWWQRNTYVYGAWIRSEIVKPLILQQGKYYDPSLGDSYGITNQLTSINATEGDTLKGYYVPSTYQGGDDERQWLFGIFHSIQNWESRSVRRNISTADVDNVEGRGGKYSEATNTVLRPLKIEQSKERYKKVDVKRRACVN